MAAVHEQNDVLKHFMATALFRGLSLRNKSNTIDEKETVTSTSVRMTLMNTNQTFYEHHYVYIDFVSLICKIYHYIFPEKQINFLIILSVNDPL